MGLGFIDITLECVGQECPWWFKKILLISMPGGLLSLCDWHLLLQLDFGK